jgi:hypothetical protein
MTHVDEFPIVIRRTKNGFVAEAAAFGLARSGPDVKTLEADMRAAVGEILAVCDRHGARIDPSRESEVARSAPSPYSRTIVSATAAVLIVVIVSLPVLLIYQKMSSLLSPVEQFNSTGYEKLLRSGVTKTADTLEMITPERRNQLTRDFGRIARALEPYADQLRPLLVPAPVPPAQPANDRQ